MHTKQQLGIPRRKDIVESHTFAKSFSFPLRRIVPTGIRRKARKIEKKRATVSPGEEAWGKQVLEINLLTLPSDKLRTLKKQFHGHKPRGWTKRTIQDRPLFGKGAAKMKGYFLSVLLAPIGGGDRGRRFNLCNIFSSPLLLPSGLP